MSPKLLGCLQSYASCRLITDGHRPKWAGLICCMHLAAAMSQPISGSQSQRALQDPKLQSLAADACLVQQGLGAEHRSSVGWLCDSSGHQKAQPVCNASPPARSGELLLFRLHILCIQYFTMCHWLYTFHRLCFLR